MFLLTPWNSLFLLLRLRRFLWVKIFAVFSQSSRLFRTWNSNGMKRGSFEMFTSDTWMEVGCWGWWDVRSHGVECCLETWWNASWFSRQLFFRCGLKFTTVANVSYSHRARHKTLQSISRLCQTSRSNHKHTRNMLKACRFVWTPSWRLLNLTQD
jgi:hypothetical protein